MKYINPLVLLGLSSSEVDSLDPISIKKLRRRLYAEIELADDGAFHQNGATYSRWECDKALEDLESPDNLSFHGYLLNNSNLLALLTHGDMSLFRAPLIESNYLDTRFRDFISPFFAPRFDKALHQAFLASSSTGILSPQGASPSLENVLKLQILVAPVHEALAYRSLYNELQSRINDLQSITEEVTNEESDYDEETVEELTTLVQTTVPIEPLNTLPSYFQGTRNKLAAQVNRLCLAIWNTYNTTLVPYNLLEHLLLLDLDSASRPQFEKNFGIVKAKHLQRLDEHKHSVVFKLWAKRTKEINELIEMVTAKNILAQNVKVDIDTTELNALGGFADEVRDVVANRLRELSVSVWNSYNHHSKAMELLYLAFEIRTSPEVKKRLQADIVHLLGLKQKDNALPDQAVVGKPVESAPTLHLINGCGTTMYGSTHYFVIFGIPIYPIGRYLYESSGNHYRFTRKLPLHTYQLVWRYVLVIYLAYLVFTGLFN